MSERVCAVEECGEPVRARGWCRRHYMRWHYASRKSGAVVVDLRKRGKTPPCTEPGCEQLQVRGGMCLMHLRRWEALPWWVQCGVCGADCGQAEGDDVWALIEAHTRRGHVREAL